MTASVIRDPPHGWFVRWLVQRGGNDAIAHRSMQAMQSVENEISELQKELDKPVHTNGGPPPAPKKPNYRRRPR